MHLIEEKNSELALMKYKILQSEAQFRREKIQKLAVASSATSHSSVDKSEFQVRPSLRISNYMHNKIFTIGPSFFQIQILNSVIADQQNKILDLQNKLTESTIKLPLPPSLPELTNKDSGDAVR